MAKRRALVIGSQCAALPGLSFLPRVAEELAGVLCDPELGGCAPALPDGRGLLVDPTVEEADQAIEAAMASASAAADTLLLAFVGHGEHVGENFYLLPKDAAWPPDLRHAVLLATRVQELLAYHSGLDGLMLLVDACHSGLGAIQAAEDWPRTVAQAGGRFEVLTSADDREAADGCFTATLVQLLRSGEPSRGENLRCADVKELVQQACGKQVATWLAFDGRRFTQQGDAGLWLGRNQARRRGLAPLAGTPAWGQVEQLTAWFERTPQLDQLVAACQTARCVALVGPAGQGKSALAAALARWELADDLVPPRFVHALAFAASATLEVDLARDLAAQLALTVEGFSAAASTFEAQSSEEELARLGPLARQILGPLRLLDGRRFIRLAVDGLDQLTPQAAPSVHAALSKLATDPKLSHVRLVVAARPDASLPPGSEVLELGQVDRPYLERYLRRRGVTEVAVSVIADRAIGNWLITRILADLAVEGAVEVGSLPTTLQVAYHDELRRAGSDDPARWAGELHPVLSVLAAAGVGPILPIALLCAASGRLGGPDALARVRDTLVQLRGLVVRGAPGTPDEHVGVFHPTFAEYLLTDPSLGVDEPAAHAALADAIVDLVPSSTHDTDDPLHRYAAAAEAEHLWAAGRQPQAVGALLAWQSPIPAANLDRSTAWLARLDEALGPQHFGTLVVRDEVAHWTGETGDGAGALRQYQEVLSVREREFGPDHPSTLATRHQVAFWTGETGDAPKALQLYGEVLIVEERVLGANHRITLDTRHEIARWTGRTGDIRGALRLFRDVLAARERIYGPDHPYTLTSRHEVAGYTGQTGNIRRALRLFREVLAVEERVLGPDHPSTLATRHNIAYLTGQLGDAREALQLSREVLAARERVLGPDHPDTLVTSDQVASYTGQTGDIREALRLHRGVLAAEERVLGPDHPYTLTSRHQVAGYTGQTGNIRRALRLYREVLAARERVLGPDHPDTLATRHQVASSLGETGDTSGALRLFREVLASEERVLGPDHPQTLVTRHQIAHWTGRTGDIRGALRLLREVLAVEERVLGRDHHSTISTRQEVAVWTRETGDIRGALRLIREVLAARERVLGPDHPETLAARHNAAALTGHSGDPGRALRLLGEVLAAEERVLGPDHPQTLMTRREVAFWSRRTSGDVELPP